MKNIFSRKNILIIIFLILAIILLPRIFSGTKNPQVSTGESVNKTESIKIGEKIIKAEVADTRISREKGLSGRKNLEKNTGMLFVFKEEALHSFWMKEMQFPIDIIWINKNFEIVSIKENALPGSYPETFSPSQPSLYVLEVESGFSQKNNLKKGQTIDFLPS